MKKTLVFFAVVFLMCFLFQSAQLLKTLDDNAVIAESPAIASATPVGFTRNRVFGYAIHYIYRVGTINYPISRSGSVGKEEAEAFALQPNLEVVYNTTTPSVSAFKNDYDGEKPHKNQDEALIYSAQSSAVFAALLAAGACLQNGWLRRKRPERIAPRIRKKRKPRHRG